MKRKILFGLLALTCACTAWGAIACTNSGDNNTNDNKNPEKDPPNYTPPNDSNNDTFTFELNEDESGYIVTGLAEGVTEANITIPATYNNLPVLEIGYLAFGNCTQLTSVTISEGISIINNGAFTQCTNIVSFKFPDSITVIRESAFQNCSGLLMVRFNETSKLRQISANAFQNCSKITQITIPDKVVNVGDRAFQGCSALKTANFGNSVEVIGIETFRGCKKLETVTLGNSLKEVGAKAFLNCDLITEMHFPITLERVALGALQGCTGIKKLTIPFVGSQKYDEPVPDSEVKTSEIHTNFGYIFGANNFDDHYSLNLDALETLIITGDSPIGYHAFQSIGRWTDEFGLEAVGLSTIIITGNVKVFGIGAFQSCYNLHSLVIPKSITKIGGQALGECLIEHIFYCGTAWDWLNVDIGTSEDNPILYPNTYKYYYSEAVPARDGKYWHYVDGVPTVW